MNKRKLLRKMTVTLLLGGLVAGGWGAAAPSAQTAAAAPACGSGDHGLLQELQAKQASDGNAPLSFNDISFLSGDTGRAAGNGFMIGTSNGGCQFQTIYEGQWNFRQMSFPDNVHGWALASVQDGSANYLIATSDGGSTWKRLGQQAVTFERINFQDHKHGFGYNRASTYYTADGGASWSRIPTPPNTRGAEFTSRSSGWAVVVAPGEGYRVMKTADGGKSWSLALKAKYSYPEYGRVYVGGKQVYALLYGETGMSQTSYSLYASSDNGAHFRRVIAESTAGGGPAPGSGQAQHTSGPASGKPGNMQLAGGSTAFLAGYSPAGEQVAVGRTYNGGADWVNLPAIEGYEGVISFPDKQKGWLAASGPEGSSLYATADGGANWKVKFTFKGTE
ncbi:hypothetical protein [Paenibacillus tengchongensis]|uniref:hypothetical protein n=1 Tax=Paenibacillus tengchongensis TaxID=2608684 RepID=UPI00124CDEC6|nr:hypothetical protein [Paenibacillus tengchongensis]